jgi:hypothetical protein
MYTSIKIDKLPNSIINCHHVFKRSLLMPLANALQLFDGNKARIIFEAKREISAVDMRDRLIVIGEKASPGQLISAILIDIDHPEHPRIFNYQKTRIDFVSISLDGEFVCSVGSSSEER